MSLDNHERVMSLFRALHRLNDPRIRNLHPAYASVLIDFDPLRLSHEEATSLIEDLAGEKSSQHDLAANIVTIPVCYDIEFASRFAGGCESRKNPDARSDPAALLDDVPCSLSRIHTWVRVPRRPAGDVACAKACYAAKACASGFGSSRREPGRHLSRRLTGRMAVDRTHASSHLRSRRDAADPTETRGSGGVFSDRSRHIRCDGASLDRRNVDTRSRPGPADDRSGPWALWLFSPGHISRRRGGQPGDAHRKLAGRKRRECCHVRDDARRSHA